MYPLKILNGAITFLLKRFNYSRFNSQYQHDFIQVLSNIFEVGWLIDPAYFPDFLETNICEWKLRGEFAVVYISGMSQQIIFKFVVSIQNLEILVFRFPSVIASVSPFKDFELHQITFKVCYYFSILYMDLFYLYGA